MAETCSIDLQAPIELVWAVLSNIDSYPEWNPLIPRAVGTLAPG